MRGNLKDKEEYGCGEKLGDLDSYGEDPRRIEYAGSEAEGQKGESIMPDYKAKYPAGEAERNYPLPQVLREADAGVGASEARDETLRDSPTKTVSGP